MTDTMRAPRRRPSRLAWVGVTAAAVALTGLVTYGLIVDDTEQATAAPSPSLIAGVHVLLQVGSSPTTTVSQASTQLAGRKSALQADLAIPGVKCLGIRTGWNLLANADGSLNPTLLNQARGYVTEPGDCLTVRIMAGRWTPARVMTACPMHVAGTAGEQVPAPYNSAGVVNQCFVDQQAQLLEAINDWADGAGAPVGIIHGAHPGSEWSEVYAGQPVQRIMDGALGYTATETTAFVASIHALDVMLAQLAVDHGRAHERPSSGNGPIMAATDHAGIVDRAAEEAVTLVGAESPNLYTQANGWGAVSWAGEPAQRWGAPDASTEHRMDFVLSPPRLLFAVQAINPLAYNATQWDAMFDEADGATYAELYDGPSWEGTSRTALTARIASWVPYVPAAPPPPTTTTTAPTTTTTTTAPPVGTCEAQWNGAVVDSRQTVEAECRLA